MLQRIEMTGLMINRDGDYYINKKNSETLLLVDKFKDHLILLNPATKNTYHCIQATFDKLISKKKMQMAEYILDYTYTEPGKLMKPERNTIGFEDLKSLKKGITNVGGKTPGEPVHFDQFTLKNKETGGVIYSGKLLDELTKAVSSLDHGKKAFRPSAININQLLQKIGLNKSDEPSQSNKSRRSR